jgi:hypothetical protein
VATGSPGIGCATAAPTWPGWLSRQGRLQSVRDNLRVKEVRVGQGDAARRFVLCHNPEQAERDRVQREQQLALVATELVRAHVLLCWLALLLVRVAERQTASTWRRINTELGRLHPVTLAGSAGRMEQTTTLTPTQRELFAATGVAPPTRVTALQPG